MPLTYLLGFATVLLAVVMGVRCSAPESAELSPEQLIEQQPSGAGVTEEREQRPGYFRQHSKD